MSASKVTIAAKASNSTSLANSSNSAISASASSTVSSIVSQGATSEEPCTATVASVQKIISKTTRIKMQFKTSGLIIFF